jgi:hypothetical protein
MGAPTTAKRGDARPASREPSQLKHEVVGVLLITLSLLTLLCLLSFADTDPLLFSSGGSTAASHSTRNMIGTVGATFATGLFWLVGGGRTSCRSCWAWWRVAVSWQACSR